MRKVVVSTIMSLDGYVAGPGDDVMALPMDVFFDEHNLERQRSADTLLVGGRSYLGFKAFWPEVAKDPAASPALGTYPHAAEVAQETGRRNDELRKVVVSDSLTGADTAPWTDTTTIVRRSDAHSAVAALRSSSDGGDILVFGSRTLWNDLLAAGLVDELYVMVGPVALGGGTPAFSAAAGLTLLDVRRREGSGNDLLRYAAGRS